MNEPQEHKTKGRGNCRKICKYGTSYPRFYTHIYLSIVVNSEDYEARLTSWFQTTHIYHPGVSGSYPTPLGFAFFISKTGIIITKITLPIS